MKITSILCEFNPMHNGHARLLSFARENCGRDGAVVCLMSGNFVQRGHPAIYHKRHRAEAALRSGADLVLELPTPYALRSAEGFAAGAVEILGAFSSHLCFGVESGHSDALMETANALLAPEFSHSLRQQLDRGLSFPAARQNALEDMGQNAALLADPNNILGVEYCKAILSTGTRMQPLVLHRPGSYHAETAEVQHPSATSLRKLALEGGDLSAFVPWDGCLAASIHTLEAGERAILARLRTMTDQEFEALPYGSEGLWRKFMHECRRQATLEEILTAVKSKRYTRTRLDRMAMCAFLGLTAADLTEKAPYIRVLGFTQQGRLALRKARETGDFFNIGQPLEHPYAQREKTWEALYGLFAQDAPEPPNTPQFPISL